jgi:hypothetical protein
MGNLGPRLWGTVDEIPMRLALDSVATASIISLNQVRRNNWKINDSRVRIKNADNSIKAVVGITDPLKINVSGNAVRMPLLVLEHDHDDVLLGLDWLRITRAKLCPATNTLELPGEIVLVDQAVDLEETTEDCFVEVEVVEDFNFGEEFDWHDLEGKKIIPPENLDKKQMSIFNALIEENLEIFATSLADLKTCKIGAHIIETTTESSIYVPPYRVSLAERQFLKKEMDEMLKYGIIEKSKSEWSSPVIIIPKGQKEKRICIDYRKLNAITKTQRGPVPLAQDVFDSLGGSRWFTVLDLASGYWQVRMHENSKDKTAFSTPDGHFQFTRVPFGLKNAPIDFNRIMNAVIGRRPFVVIYFDDITIHSASFEEHVEHVSFVLKKVKDAQLRLKPSKCRWFCKKAKILGHVISEGKIAMDESKVEAIKNREPPKNVKHIQQF